MEVKEVEGLASGQLYSFIRKEVMIPRELGRSGLLGRTVGILLRMNGRVWGSRKDKSIWSLVAQS